MLFFPPYALNGLLGDPPIAGDDAEATVVKSTTKTTALTPTADEEEEEKEEGDAQGKCRNDTAKKKVKKCIDKRCKDVCTSVGWDKKNVTYENMIDRGTPSSRTSSRTSIGIMEELKKKLR